MGVSAGMSWWATPQAMLFIAPLTLWLLLDFRRTLPKVGFATLGFLVGSFPWIYRNLHTHFLSFNTDGIPPTSYIFRVRTFFGLGFPTLLNLRNWMRGPTEFLITTKGAKLVAVVVFIFLAVQAIRIIRDQRKSAAALFSLMFLLYPFIAAISPITFSGGEGRYMWFIVPALCVVLLSSWPVVRSSRMLVGLWIAIIVSGMYVSYVTARGYPDIQRGVATIQFGPVVERILDEDVHYVAANYWTAYRLNAESQGKIVATPFDYGVRIEKNRELVSRRIDGIVFEKNMNGEARIISFLTENDIAYTKKMFDGVTLYKVSRSDFTDEQLHELLNPK